MLNEYTENKVISEQDILINSKDNKIISKLKEYFLNCEEFQIIVAFILPSGVSLLKTVLKDLESKGIKGKIITGNYQNFTSPYAIDELNALSNIEIKMIRDKNLHMKAYFFRSKSNWNMIVGSSNLTQFALTTNEELNIKITANENSELVSKMNNVFNNLWSKALSYNNFIDEYKMEYEKKEELNQQYVKFTKEYLNDESLNNQDIFENNLNINYEIKPNVMQKQALNNLTKIHKAGKNKALIIAATGTGKTYLGAFDVLKVKPKKMLFIVHRENIAKRAKNSFASVIKDRKLGLYTGNIKEKADYIFATIQSIYNNLELFEKSEFDYIIIDEVHHSGARTYQEILKYFNYKFLLGLTATPKRSDDFNIFEMFDFNIAYEIGLNEAYEYDLLTPFHYFGVSEIDSQRDALKDSNELNNSSRLNSKMGLNEQKSKKEVTFKHITLKERVEHIISKVNYYKDSSLQTRGLMFVSKTSEAIQLSEQLNLKGMKTRALTSKDKEDIRLQAISDLEEGRLEYIITVDIFNEGIDIACVNQVVLMRPTESAIIYVQQIGRGLRKYPNKDFITIIDFIGNYKNNFLIPIALSGDNTYDKDILRDSILPNITNYIVGSSVINFEKVAQEAILNNINKTNFANINLIKDDFIYLEKRLNRVPTLNDFYENKVISPLVILRYKKIYLEVKSSLLKNQINNQKVNGKRRYISSQNINDVKAILSDKKSDMYLYLEYLSQKLTPAKREEEFQIIKLFLDRYVKEASKVRRENINSKDSKLNYMDEGLTFKQIKEELEGNKIKVRVDTLQNALDHLSKSIFKSLSSLYKFHKIIDIDKETLKYKLCANFLNYYLLNNIFKEEVDDLIKLNLRIFNDKYSKNSYIKSNVNRKIDNQKKDELIHIGEYYTKEEAFKYLLLDYSNGYQVGGYTLLKDKKVGLIFITLLDTTYSNKFFSNKTFNWFSKKNRKLKYADGEFTTEGLVSQGYFKLYVFMKKEISQDFIYIGDVGQVLEAHEIEDENNNKLVEYLLELKKPLDDELFKRFDF